MPYLNTINRVVIILLSPNTFEKRKVIRTFVFTYGIGLCFKVRYRKDRGVRRDMREA